jgi:hypothetical protein
MLAHHRLGNSGDRVCAPVVRNLKARHHIFAALAFLNLISAAMPHGSTRKQIIIIY